MRSILSNQQVDADRTLVRRVLLGICTLILALQLIGSAFHDHHVSEQLSDCVSCHIAGHLPADIPAAGAALLAVFLVFAYLLARLPKRIDIPVRRYLLPARQGPPKPALSR